MAKAKLKAFEEIKAADGEAKQAEKPEPFTDITPRNYLDRVKEFIKLQPGFVIAWRKCEVEKGGQRFNATVMEWGAWRAWRRWKGLPTSFMDKRDYFCVPSRWPHEFDALWSEAQSRRAGEKFFDEILWRQKEEQRPVDERRAIVEQAMRRTFPKAKYPPEDFPFGGRVYQTDKPTHPPVYGTVFYDEAGNIIDPPPERHPKDSTFKRVGEK